ncbi:MAG: rhodanese-like domain-containing protein [Alphaproteobacteria bacterium]|nr:rhodanese-like domain-containing protein [Alphaproteobacteria bacterium]
MAEFLKAEQIANNNRQFGYAGDVSVEDAWGLLQANPSAAIVDVRTPQEWEQVGVPDLASLDKPLHRVTWRMLPDGSSAARFAEAFGELELPKDTPLLLLCKAGGRSQAAALALTAAGYSCCLNVAGGFEGQNGWLSCQLPSCR